MQVLPTGFDPVNSAGCTFTSPISNITLELTRGEETIFEQKITLDPPSELVGFPLSEDLVDVVPADMEPGPYDRRIRVTSTDAESMVLISDTIWVFDPAGHPVAGARRALAERLGVELDVTFLQTYEPVILERYRSGLP